MGRDLTLYPERASRGDLKTYLEGMGFKKCKHLWDWPTGTLNYSWFDDVDFRSVDGVSADVFPVSDEKEKITGNEWALHVRNLYSASWYDVQMLNEVLRGARKQFGGIIKGDYGTNRYAPLWVDESTPVSRGMSAVYQRASQDISTVKYALPEPSMRLNPPEAGDARAKELVEFMSSFDPSRVIYNGLVPFAIAVFEFFFSRAFKILISYDVDARAKLATHSMKVDFSALLTVSSGERTVEDVITETYTFQNLSQLNKAYRDWLGIDVRKLLYKKKRMGRSVAFLENRIAEIIEYRHGVIHRLELDPSLTREELIAILDAVQAAVDEFVVCIENKYGIKIDQF